MTILLLIAAMLSVQVGASLAKGLFPAIGPLPVTMLRIWFAAVVLVLLHRPWRKTIDARAFKPIVFYGLSLGIMNSVFYLALTRIPLGLCVGIEFLGPLTVPILSSRKKIDVFWTVLAAVGIFLILPLKGREGQLDPLGIALALVTGLCWGLYIVFGRRVGQAVDSGTATSLGMVVAALVTLPFGLATSNFELFHLDVLRVGLMVGVLSSVIPYSLEMIVLKKMETRSFGILMSLDPVVAGLAGLVLLGELLLPSQWLAIGLIVMASAGTTITSKTEKSAVPLEA
jgi:inner membrane transporter RhtA